MRFLRVRPTFRRLFLVGSLAFLALLCSTSGPFRSVKGQGVTAQEANAQLWNCFVPDDATDVWYTSSYSYTQVECTIEPESLRLWCERMGWHLGPINKENPAFILSDRRGPFQIDSGLWFNARNVKSTLGCAGVYDPRNKRAYVTYISR